MDGNGGLDKIEMDNSRAAAELTQLEFIWSKVKGSAGISAFFIVCSNEGNIDGALFAGLGKCFIGH